MTSDRLWSRARLVLAGVVVVAATLASVGRAQAAFPGRNGLLAVGYQADGCGGGRIATMWPSGAGFRNLTPGGCRRGGIHAILPSWAPSGRRMVFEAQAGGRQGVMEMRADGTQRFWLELPPIRDPGGGLRWVREHPVFAPDGFHIALRSRPPDDSSWGGVWITTTAGDDYELVLPGEMPRWSPDGSAIAYDAAPETPTPETVGTWLADPATGLRLRRVSSRHPDSIDWSPDGHSLVLVEDGAVVVVGADGQGRRRVAGSSHAVEFRAAVWSPDGRKFAVVRQARCPRCPRSHGAPMVRYSIWVMSRRGTHRRRIWKSGPRVDPGSADAPPPALDWQARPSGHE